ATPGASHRDIPPPPPAARDPPRPRPRRVSVRGRRDTEARRLPGRGARDGSSARAARPPDRPRTDAPAGCGCRRPSRPACRSSRRSPSDPRAKAYAYCSAMIEIRPLVPADWPVVEAIWSEGIDTRNATFEVETPSWESFDAGRHPEHRLVATLDGAIAGW